MSVRGVPCWGQCAARVLETAIVFQWEGEAARQASSTGDLVKRSCHPRSSNAARQAGCGPRITDVLGSYDTVVVGTTHPWSFSAFCLRKDVEPSTVESHCTGKLGGDRSLDGSLLLQRPLTPGKCCVCIFPDLGTPHACLVIASFHEL